MNGSPTTVLAVTVAIASMLAMQLAAALPDPGDPTFPTVTAVVGGFLAIARARFRRRPRSWKEAEREAFRWGFYFTGAGIVVYLFGLISGLY